MDYLIYLIYFVLLIILAIFICYIVKLIKTIKSLKLNETNQKLALIKDNKVVINNQKIIIDNNLKPKLSFIFKLYLVSRLFKKKKDSKFSKAKYYFNGINNIFS